MQKITPLTDEAGCITQTINVDDSVKINNGWKTFHTLWTGGLDSTTRVAQLSRLPVNVKLYYVLDSSRPSTPIELCAMERILYRLRHDSATKANLSDLIKIHVDEIPADEAITHAWRELNRKYGVGSQYDFLARYAKERDIVFELSVEKGDGRAQQSINAESEMEAVNSNFHINKQKSSSEAALLFDRFDFPLWDKNKHDEVRLLESLGLGDLVEMTWFCHTPLFGKPCGHCNPCKDVRHYGFSWRLSRTNWLLWYVLRPKLVAKLLLRTLRLH